MSEEPRAESSLTAHPDLFVGLSARLDRAMVLRGLDVYALAQQARVAPNTIARVLKGENVSVRILADLAKALRVPLRDLIPHDQPQNIGVRVDEVPRQS